LTVIGALFFEFLSAIGKISSFTGKTFFHMLVPKYYFRQIGRQMVEIGYFSLPIVGLTAVFTGAVLALQTYTGFSRFNAESSIAAVVVISITRELGPVLA
jgi:phospholipid/cholesterol/gamma-HCH transport system permease protein